MALTGGVQKKAVEVHWVKENLRGAEVSLQVMENGDWVEKKTGPNDGKAELTFANDFSGTVQARAADSHGSTEPGTFTVA